MTGVQVIERTYSWGTLAELFRDGQAVMFVDLYTDGTWLAVDGPRLRIGQPRDLADESTGSPFYGPASDWHEPGKPVAEHFERVEVPRGINRDGVVRIAQPGTNKPKAAKGTKEPKPAAQRKAAVRATIRVIHAF